MAKVQAEFITRIKQILRDDANIVVDDGSETALKAHLSDAVELIYDDDRPRLKYQSYTGDGGYDYDKPSDWINGFSKMETLEYPSGYQEPEMLDPELFRLYNNGSTEKIRFTQNSPSASETFILAYTLPHVLDGSNNSTSESDFQALCHLATAIVLLAMTNKYTQSSAPTITASAVAFRDKSDRCRAAAKEQFTLYDKAMEKNEETQGAIVIREYDTTFAWGGEYLTHPENWR